MNTKKSVFDIPEELTDPKYPTLPQFSEITGVSIDQLKELVYRRRGRKRLKSYKKIVPMIVWKDRRVIPIEEAATIEAMRKRLKKE